MPRMPNSSLPLPVAKAAAWRESDHPRDARGRWTRTVAGGVAAPDVGAEVDVGGKVGVVGEGLYRHPKTGAVSVEVEVGGKSKYVPLGRISTPAGGGDGAKPEPITGRGREAIEVIGEPDGSAAVNSYLRGGPDQTVLGMRASEAVAEIDGVMGARRTASAEVLYSARPKPSADGEPAFVSTTRDRRVAQVFAEINEVPVWELEVPAGTPAVDMEAEGLRSGANIEPLEGGQLMREREVLLGRGLRFEAAGEGRLRVAAA